MSESVRTASRWANRFIMAAMVQGAIALALIAVLLYLAVFGVPAVSRIVASGSAGTWLTVGFVGYVMVGVLATAISALFYQHIEAFLGRPYSGYRDILAWLHLVLMNVGALVAGGLMMYAGYIGGSGLLPESVGGGGLSAGEVHELIAAYPLPIAIFMGIGALGVLLGGIGYLMSWLSRSES